MSVHQVSSSSSKEISQIGGRSREAASGMMQRDDERELPARSNYRRPNTRLIVLVPAEKIDSKQLLQALLPLVDAATAKVVFLALALSDDTASSAQLEALVRHAKAYNLASYSQMIPASRWLHALELIVRPSDLVVCHAEHQRGRLASEIGQHLNVKTHLLSGFYPSLFSRLLHRMVRIGFEILPLATIALFFWLQVQIEEQTTGWITTVSLVASIMVEIAILFVWGLFVR